MRNSLNVYLISSYVKYYIGLLALWLSFAGPLILNSTTAAVLFLSFIATLAICCVMFQMSLRSEFETLQSYGQSLRGIAIPLAAASLGPQVLLSVIAVAFSGGQALVVFAAMLAVVGTILSFSVILVFAWIMRDAGALKACLLGFGAQCTLVGMALGLVPLAGIFVSSTVCLIAAMAIVTYLAAKRNPLLG